MIEIFGLTFLGWIGLSAAIGTQVTSLAGAGWGIFATIVALFVPLVIVPLDLAADASGGCLSLFVLVIFSASAIWAITSAWMVSLGMFWAVLLAVMFSVVWLLLALVSITILNKLKD